MIISYAVTVCNEEREIKQLLDFLLKHKRSEDEICVLVDKPKANLSLLDMLYGYSSNNHILLKESIFNNNFSEWKNELNQMCKGNYIFNIDADEIPHENLIYNLPFILENNPKLEAIWIPRVNTVDGLTNEHIKKWGWVVNEKGWVNWPDVQMRIYLNSSEVIWKNKVHEILDGYKTFSYLSQEEEWCLYHHKHIERQERQNEFYNRI